MDVLQPYRYRMERSILLTEEIRQMAIDNAVVHICIDYWIDTNEPIEALYLSIITELVKKSNHFENELFRLRMRFPHTLQGVVDAHR